MRLWFRPHLGPFGATFSLGGRRRPARAPAKPPRSAAPAVSEKNQTAVRQGLLEARERVLAESLPGEQRSALEGWYAAAIAALDELMRTGDDEAYTRFREASGNIKRWREWKPTQQCDHCGAREQTAGSPCSYCRETV